MSEAKEEILILNKTLRKHFLDLKITDLSPIEYALVAQQMIDLFSVISAFFEQEGVLNHEKRVVRTASNKMSTSIKQRENLINRLESINQELEKVETETMKTAALQREVEEKEQRIKSIEIFRNKYSDEDLDILSIELKKAEEGIASEIEKIERLAEQLSQQVQGIADSYGLRTKNMLKQVDKNKKLIREKSEGLIEHLKKENLLLELATQKSKKNLAALIDSYNHTYNTVSEIKQQIREVETAHSQNVVTYNKHFTANQEVFEDLSGNINVNTRANTIMDKIDSQLKEFDKILGEVIRENDNIQLVALPESEKKIEK